jgi:hypothetical protein
VEKYKQPYSKEAKVPNHHTVDGSGESEGKEK